MNEPYRRLILGMGNTLLSDSGVGVYAARRLRETLKRTDVAVEESDLDGLNILNLIDGFDQVIIVDSIKTECGILGNIYRVNLSDPRYCECFPDTSHIDVDIIRQRRGMANIYVPRSIVLYAVEAKDTTTFGKGCSDEVLNVIPRLTDLITKELEGRFSVSK